MASEFLRNFIASLTTTKSLNDRKCFNPGHADWKFLLQNVLEFSGVHYFWTRGFTNRQWPGYKTPADLGLAMASVCLCASLSLPLCACFRFFVRGHHTRHHAHPQTHTDRQTDRQTDGRAGGSESARGGKAAPGRAVQSCAVRVSNT